jgi:hypothetical protein
MPKPMRTKPVSGAQVRPYAGKAQEYADAAASEVDQGCFIAATSLAIHAAINAADASSRPPQVRKVRGGLIQTLSSTSSAARLEPPFSTSRRASSRPNSCCVAQRNARSQPTRSIFYPSRTRTGESPRASVTRAHGVGIYFCI